MPIENLDPTVPADGDSVSDGASEIRDIKAEVQDSFPSLGASAVTVDAGDLNDVVNKLASFNGRTDVDVVPAEGDYSTDLLGDVDTSTDSPIPGDMLRFDGSNFVPRYTGISAAQLTAQSYNGSGEFKIEIDVEDFATLGLTVDLTNNRITNETGRTITALVSLDFYYNDISVDSYISVRKNGVVVGEEMYSDRAGSNTDVCISLKRVVSLANTEYVEGYIRRPSAEDTDITSGGTLTVQGV